MSVMCEWPGHGGCDRAAAIGFNNNPVSVLGERLCDYHVTTEIELDLAHQWILCSTTIGARSPAGCIDYRVVNVKVFVAGLGAAKVYRGPIDQAHGFVAMVRTRVVRGTRDPVESFHNAFLDFWHMNHRDASIQAWAHGMRVEDIIGDRHWEQMIALGKVTS